MAEPPRSRLPSGYHEEFVSEVEDDLRCLICHLPLKEPVLTRCGHRFCKECIEEHFRRCAFSYIYKLILNCVILAQIFVMSPYNESRTSSLANA